MLMNKRERVLLSAPARREFLQVREANGGCRGCVYGRDNVAMCMFTCETCVKKVIVGVRL